MRRAIDSDRSLDSDWTESELWLGFDCCSSGHTWAAHERARSAAAAAGALGRSMADAAALGLVGHDPARETTGSK